MQENNFDLLRVIAAVQVMIIHTLSHILLEYDYELNIYGVFVIKILSYIQGVPIFFLISGFLITMSYDRNSNLRDYIQNRFLRIFPGLYVNIFLIIISLVSFFIWNYDLNSTREVFMNKLLHVSILPYIFLFILGIFSWHFIEKPMLRLNNIVYLNKKKNNRSYYETTNTVI